MHLNFHLSAIPVASRVILRYPMHYIYVLDTITEYCSSLTYMITFSIILANLLSIYSVYVLGTQSSSVNLQDALIESVWKRLF